jgi:hypothetical protein
LYVQLHGSYGLHAMLNIIKNGVIAALVMVMLFFHASAQVSVRTGIINSRVSDIYLQKLAIPQFEGFPAADEINSLIQSHIADLFGEVNGAYYISGGGYPQGAFVGCGFDYYAAGNILSLQLNTEAYAGNGNPTARKTCYTINTKTGEHYTLASLFTPGSDYRGRLTGEILNTVQSSPESYNKRALISIINKLNDYKFYIYNGRLAIYFDLYEIAPLDSAFPTFWFDLSSLSDILGEDIPVELPRNISQISLNGAPIDTDKYIFFTENKTLMVPLRAVAEAFGYTVSWDDQLGAGIAGGYLKAGINSYPSDRQTPVSLAYAPCLIDGSMYVPKNYFTQVLNQLADGIGRLGLYTNTDPANDFNRQIPAFSLPQTAESCVSMYVDAVRDGNGAIQYALCDAELRKKVRTDLQSKNWRTESFLGSAEVERKTDINYLITFRPYKPENILSEFSVSLNAVSYGNCYRVRWLEEPKNLTGDATPKE